MKRRSLLLLATCFPLCGILATTLHAQNFVSVTAANVQNAFGQKLATGQVCFQAANNNGVPIAFQAGGGGQVINRPVCGPVANGAFSVSVPNTALTAPANVCFHVTVKDSSTNQLVLGNAPSGQPSGYDCVQPAANNAWCSSGSCNFDNYTPNLAPLVVVQSGPVGPQGPQGPIGATGATGSLPAGVMVNGNQLVVPGGLQGPIQSNLLYTLRGTYTKLAAMTANPPAQLRIAVVGDSTAGSHINSVIGGLTAAFGIAGFVGGGGATTVAGYPIYGADSIGSGSGGAYLIDGNTYAYDYMRSPTGVYYYLPVGGCWTWGSAGGYFTANLLKLYYIAEPGAGTLTLSSNNNGAGWVSTASVNASDTSTIGAVLTAAMGNAAPYEIQACASLNPVRVFAAAFINSTANGIVNIGAFNRPGLSINQWNSTPSAVVTPWLADVLPDLVTIEWKTGNDQSSGNGTTGYVMTDGSTFLQGMTTSVAAFQAANSLADFLFIGSNPVLAPSDNSGDINNNAVLQTIAANNGFFYWDGYNSALNPSTLQALGWITTGTSPHLTNLGQLATTEMLWRDLGFGGMLTGASGRNVSALSVVQSPLVTLLGVNPTVNVANTSYPLALVGGSGGLLVKDTSGTVLQLRSSSNPGVGNNTLPPFAINGKAWLTASSSTLACISNSQNCGGSASVDLQIRYLRLPGGGLGGLWSGTASNVDAIGSLTLSNATSQSFTFVGTYNQVSCTETPRFNLGSATCWDSSTNAKVQVTCSTAVSGTFSYHCDFQY